MLDSLKRRYQDLSYKYFCVILEIEIEWKDRQIGLCWNICFLRLFLNYVFDESWSKFDLEVLNEEKLNKFLNETC